MNKTLEAYILHYGGPAGKESVRTVLTVVASGPEAARALAAATAEGGEIAENWTNAALVTCQLATSIAEPGIVCTERSK